MKAKLIFHEKIILADESIVESKIWKVPKSKKYKKGVRYSLFYVQKGKVIIGYDNHYPKGPHRHYENKEEPYHFSNVDQLIEDFKNDLRRVSS